MRKTAIKIVETTRAAWGMVEGENMASKRCVNTAAAIEYLGIKRRSFETHILPRLKGKGIKVGTSIVFEVADVDMAWESYKIDSGSGRPGSEGAIWDAGKPPVSTHPQRAGMKLINASKVTDFDSVASQVLTRRNHG